MGTNPITRSELPDATPKALTDRSIRDRYGDPGSVVGVLDATDTPSQDKMVTGFIEQVQALPQRQPSIH